MNAYCVNIYVSVGSQTKQIFRDSASFAPNI